MAKTRKILDIRACGQHIYCIFDSTKENPYRVYKEDWVYRANSNHPSMSRKQIAKYANFISVMYLLKDYFKDNPQAWQ